MVLQLARVKVRFQTSLVCLLAMKDMVQVYITSQRGMEVIDKASIVNDGGS